jgi:hypothetical protein
VAVIIRTSPQKILPLNHSACTMRFTHPPLSTGVDAIRVLKVAPGDFPSPLVGSLTSVTFSDKPKYVALSYMWGRPYPVNTEPPPGLKFVEGPLPESAGISLDPTTIEKIIVDAEPFDVRHNLYLALLHLRSPTHAITIWVDAICINQADSNERSQQVSLMAFIYTRATRVVAWLGAHVCPPETWWLNSMYVWWKQGETQHLGALLAGDSSMQHPLDKSPSIASSYI